MSWDGNAFKLFSQRLGLSPFSSHFGTPPHVVAIVWHLIDKPEGVEPKHLLWTLLFLKVYASEDVLHNMVGTSKNTYRKWTDIILVEVFGLKQKVVSFFSPLVYISFHVLTIFCFLDKMESHAFD
jgi:hypothetical protein